MKDNFSTQAKLYAQFRPTYPQTLYDFVLEGLHSHDLAWDCATGNGQVAVVLAGHFAAVKATDISQKQLDEAKPAPTIEYLISSAEQTPFPDQCFDLITVGQALHWFDFERFNQEVRRIAKPHATIAVWGYSLLSISPEIDPVVNHFYREIVGPYWDPERRHTEDHYAQIPFPYQDVEEKIFPMQTQWNFEQLIGYFRTWSSVQKYIKLNGNDPVEVLSETLQPLWGEPQTLRTITFPVFVKKGKVL
ncbi:MAG: class I SAM-dependent methyltransferase [Spirosomataceae bacterium]